MLSQTSCHWDKQQSADSNMIQFHLTLKCTEDHIFLFLRLLLSSNWIFHQRDRALTKFHAGSEKTLVCVFINNSHYRPSKTITQLTMHLGNIECRPGLLNYTGQHKISFWDESSNPLLILGRGIRKSVLKLSVSSSFQDMGTSNIR